MEIIARESADVLQLHHQGPEIPGAEYIVKVPDGKYVVKFLGAESFWYRGRRPRLALWFQIDEGEFSETKLAAYCNLKSIENRPGRRSRDPKFVVGWRADLTMYLATLFPDRYSADTLPATIPEYDMRARKIRIETRTVTKTHTGKKRPPAFHCSVVDSVDGWATP